VTATEYEALAPNPYELLQPRKTSFKCSLLVSSIFKYRT
jgi:hypothetical protein